MSPSVVIALDDGLSRYCSQDFFFPVKKKNVTRPLIGLNQWLVFAEYIVAVLAIFSSPKKKRRRKMGAFFSSSLHIQRRKPLRAPLRRGRDPVPLRALEGLLIGARHSFLARLGASLPLHVRPSNPLSLFSSEL